MVFRTTFLDILINTLIFYVGLTLLLLGIGQFLDCGFDSLESAAVISLIVSIWVFLSLIWRVIYSIEIRDNRVRLYTFRYCNHDLPLEEVKEIKNSVLLNQKSFVDNKGKRYKIQLVSYSKIAKLEKYFESQKNTIS